MNIACNHFVGTHDFRNFCKLDNEHVNNFERTIFTCSIDSYSRNLTTSSNTKTNNSNTKSNSNDDNDEFFSIYVLSVVGSAFLRHQIRCMVAILMMVGNGDEHPNVISQMLNISETPRKPIYDIATDYPLVLYDCIYKGASSTSPPNSTSSAAMSSTSSTSSTSTTLTSTVVSTIGVTDDMKVETHDFPPNVEFEINFEYSQEYLESHIWKELFLSWEKYIIKATLIFALMGTLLPNSLSITQIPTNKTGQKEHLPLKNRPTE